MLCSQLLLREHAEGSRELNRGEDSLWLFSDLSIQALEFSDLSLMELQWPAVL